MHTESGDRRTGANRRLERAIVLVLLSEDDGARQWSRAELGDGMGVQESELGLALNGLLDSGVLLRDEDARAAVRRIRLWGYCRPRDLPGPQIRNLCMPTRGTSWRR